MLIHIIPDHAPQPELPTMPALPHPADPATSDLLAWARYMQAIACNCDVTANAGQPQNPFAAIGALRTATELMANWLQARLREEERNLLLLDRLRAEEAQERAHEELLATDDDYAAEWDDMNGEGDDDE